ncbi:transposable element Tcb1 transposase [Trichonephila clavipes]|nr:transposable element Tcb1 transposase [Trichonephila clavipes]
MDTPNRTRTAHECVKIILTWPYKAIRESLVMNLVNLSIGQMTRTTLSWHLSLPITPTHRLKDIELQQIQRESVLSVRKVVSGTKTRTRNNPSTGGIGTSGSERSHLHKDQAQDALDRPVIEKTATSRLAEGDYGSRRPLRVLPLTPTHRRLRLEWCCARGNWTAAQWNQVVFGDESRFSISSDEYRIRVWSPCGERLNPAFALE